MTMFGNNERAVRTGGAGATPQRVKRFKTRAIGLALLSLTICQAAIAQEACPTGPKKTSGADGAWDIIKIRDFGLWMGSPGRQLILCLHRGFHSNIDDDTSELGSITRGAAEHTWPSIKNAFQYAPCVELDFQARTLTEAAGDAGSSRVILSHEAVGNRVMSQYTMILGSGVVDTGLTPPNCSRTALSPRDKYGNATYSCKGTDHYNPATDTYQQPSDLHKFFGGVLASGSRDIRAVTLAL